MENLDLDTLKELLRSFVDEEKKKPPTKGPEATKGDKERPSTSRSKQNAVESKGKEKSKTHSSRLAKHLELSADSRRYMKEEKYFEAYGIIASLINLGEDACFFPVLINYYKTLIRTGRIDESVGIKEELNALVKEKLFSSPDECEQLADKYRSENEHVKAFLFYQIGGNLFSNDTEKSNSVNCLQGCILGIKLCTTSLIKQRPDLRYIVTPYVIPVMRNLYDKIRTRKSSQPKMMTLIQGLTLHHIETTELKSDDPMLREATLREAVALFEAKFGENAKKHHLYASALNNLGATLISMHKPHEAVDILNQAMQARLEAEDYDTQAEKESDVNMTERALSKAEEIIHFMK